MAKKKNAKKPVMRVVEAREKKIESTKKDVSAELFNEQDLKKQVTNEELDLVLPAMAGKPLDEEDMTKVRDILTRNVNLSSSIQVASYLNSLTKQDLLVIIDALYANERINSLVLKQLSGYDKMFKKAAKDFEKEQEDKKKEVEEKTAKAKELLEKIEGK